MNSLFKIVTVEYESPSVACCAVSVEKGYALTTQWATIENLGETKEEGEW